MRRRRRPSTLARVLLQFPLELSSILSKEDAHYLEKRARRRWWSRRSFPRVPTDTLEVAHRTPPPLAVWQKVLPLGAIFFAASFNLTILANLKDAIMVTTAGAETLPWLASCGILPASVAFFVAYGTMVERLPQRAVFYAAVAPLLAAYALFAGALYPAHAFLHPVGLTAALAGATPPGLHGALKMVEHWTFSLFYCAAELWGSVVISILFWSLANEVCTVNEAKAVYPLMGIAANVALVIAGSYLKWVNASVAHGNTQVGGWGGASRDGGASTGSGGPESRVQVEWSVGWDHGEGESSTQCSPGQAMSWGSAVESLAVSIYRHSHNPFLISPCSSC